MRMIIRVQELLKESERTFPKSLWVLHLGLAVGEVRGLWDKTHNQRQDEDSGATAADGFGHDIYHSTK